MDRDRVVALNAPAAMEMRTGTDPPAATGLANDFTRGGSGGAGPIDAAAASAAAKASKAADDIRGIEVLRLAEGASRDADDRSTENANERRRRFLRDSLENGLTVKPAAAS